MTVKQRLIGMAALAVLLLLVIGGFGFSGIAQLNQTTSQLQLQAKILGNHLTADMMHDALSSDVLAAVIASSTGDRQALSEARSDQRENAATFREMLQSNQNLITDQTTQRALQTVLPVLNDYIQSAERIVSLAETNQNQALRELNDFRSAYSRLADEMENLTELIEGEAAAVEARANSSALRSNLLMGTALGTGVLLMVFVAWIVSRSIIHPLNQLVIGAEIAATGDLSQHIEMNGKDEIVNTARALELMRANLATMVASISESANQLSSASGAMTSAVVQNRSRVDWQQAEISQVATAMHQMTATAQDVSQNISHIANAAMEANREGTAGTEVVDKTIKEIQSLAQQIEQSSVVINQLSEDSEDISQVLSTITGIAEQTNLLALNAAIEAARAGEQGRGFAVVADEVRNLASRTQQSTEQIQTTIQKLQGGSRSAVKAMESSRNKSNEVMDQARNAGASLEAIVRSVADINNMSIQIASAAEQQSSVSEDISQSLERIDSKSRETTESLEHTNNAASSVSNIASELSKAVSRFRL
ncbi:methyl-accepting chemotaxis protein [Nitrincola alkalisediminis]|uniref:methyl-accepting chemotaxis protein n=1 Tax=Nitrincola alkalisediminis TaxID=1366656 RepID=UPI001875D455|nr:methyl-accepting chemotaxis protein [Nitrincola alkalisediminis]